MEMYLKHIIPNFILMCSMVYGWHLLDNKRINFKNKRLYIVLIASMFITILNYVLTEKLFRIFIITLLLIPCFKFLFKDKIYKSIITPIFHQVIIFISEFLAVIVLSIILGNKIEIFIQSFLGVVIVNMLVALISICTIKLPFIRKLYKYILKISEKIKIYQLVVFCIIAMIFINIFVISAYYKIDFKFWVIANISLMLVLLIIVLYSMRTQNKYNKVSDKYNIAIKSLNDYENMMTKYRIANHENKNLLLTIRAMILNKDKEIPKFIDTMIEDKYEDDEKLLFNMAVIPSGGLRATIYSEILKIKDNNINYSLNIDKNLRTVDLIELDTDAIVDVCKIIGVFIDNAIDEVKRLKNKNIQISMYLENKSLNIKVSNTYKGKIEIDKISNEGYTTKGKGHGYGLSLVKNIIKNNDLFENKIEISKEIFSQILVINIKNHIK